MRWLLGVLVLFPAGPASAATFTTGCSGTTGDPASLVSAIDQANASLGPDIVELGAGCLYVLTGTGRCALAMSTDRAVTATFTPAPTLIAPPPAISALRQSVSVWREGSRLAFVTRKHQPPVGTLFSFELSEQATVTVTST